MIRQSIGAMVFFLCVGCSSGTSETTIDEGGQDTAQQEVRSLLDLSGEGFPLLLNIPDRILATGVGPDVQWVEEFGHLAVRAGDHFSMNIIEDRGDLERLKADLQRDLLHTNTILKEDADLIIYRSTFPDDPDLVFIHFYRVVQADGRSFVVQSDPQGRFNEADVEAMVMSISPKAAA